MDKIPAREYNEYLSAIKMANNLRDRDTLISIKNELYRRYGVSNEDVRRLIKQFAMNTD
jgi:hypothetical protein